MITVIHRITDGYHKLAERTVKVARTDQPSVGDWINYRIDGKLEQVKGRVVERRWNDEGLTLVVEQIGAVA